VSNTIEIKVPDIGDFSDVPVIELLVAEGDRVEAEAGLVTLESDKATMEVPSPVAGTVRDLKVKLDDTVSEGDVVAIIEVSGDDEQAENTEEAEQAKQAADEAQAEEAGDSEQAAETASADAEAEPGEEAKEQSAGQGPPEHSGEEIEDTPDTEPRPAGRAAADTTQLPYASPAIRRFARELGVDLRKVNGSGDRGRILREDVSALVKSVMSEGGAAAPAAVGGLKLNFPDLPKFDFNRYGETETVALNKIQRLSAGHLHRNWIGIPHVTQHDEADITDMEAFRLANADEAKAQGFKLTPLVFLIKAMVVSLREFPKFNASLAADGESLILKKYFNVGIAVDTPDGLVVPVLRDCERKGIMELAAELAKISGRAREKKLKPQDIQGGCISISSLGGIGGTSFTPIINAPEVAILGVSRSSMKPVWNGNEFQPRLMLPLSLSYDHRVIDGADAARFTRFFASRLEDLRRLTL
jgi:pyruvate dehydrogenase E2 component (dihydrolipoamide acetyltransferase)